MNKTVNPEVSNHDAQLRKLATDAEKRQQQLDKLKQSLQRGRLPYNLNLNQIQFDFSGELSDIRRCIIDSLESIKQTENMFRELLSGHRMDISQFVGQGDQASDMKNLPAMMVEHALNEAAQLRLQRERELNERARRLDAANKQLTKKIEGIKQKYIDCTIMNEKGFSNIDCVWSVIAFQVGPKFVRHYACLFGDLVHIEDLTRCDSEEQYLVFTDTRTVEFYATSPDPQIIARVNTKEGEKVTHRLQFFHELPNMASDEVITCIAKLARKTETIFVEKQATSNHTNALDITAPMETVIEESTDNAQETIDQTEAVETQPSVLQRDVEDINDDNDGFSEVVLDQLIFVLGTRAGRLLLLEVCIQQEVESKVFTSTLNVLWNTQCTDAPIELVYFQPMNNYFIVYSSPTEIKSIQDRVIVAYHVEERVPDVEKPRRSIARSRSIDPEDNPSSQKSLTVPEPELQDLESTKKNDQALVTVQEAWREYVSHIDTEIATSMTKLSLVIKEQQQNGTQKPFPFPIIGVRRSIFIQGPLATTLLPEEKKESEADHHSLNAANKAPGKQKASKLSAGSTSIASTIKKQEEDSIKNMSSVTAVTKDPDSNRWYLGVQSPSFPGSTFVVTLDLKVSVTKNIETTETGEPAVEEQTVKEIVTPQVFAAFTSSGSSLSLSNANSKSNTDQDERIFLLPVAEGDQVKKDRFQVESLDYFINSKSGHPSILVGTSDRSMRVISVTSSVPMEESDLVVSENDAFSTSIDARILKLGKQMELAIGFTGLGTFLLYNVGFPSCVYETRVHTTLVNRDGPFERRRILIGSYRDSQGIAKILAASQNEWSVIDVSEIRPWLEYVKADRFLQSETERKWVVLSEEVKTQRQQRFAELKEQVYGNQEEEV